MSGLASVKALLKLFMVTMSPLLTVAMVTVSAATGMLNSKAEQILVVSRLIILFSLSHLSYFLYTGLLQPALSGLEVQTQLKAKNGCII